MIQRPTSRFHREHEDDWTKWINPLDALLSKEAIIGHSNISKLFLLELESSPIPTTHSLVRIPTPPQKMQPLFRRIQGYQPYFIGVLAILTLIFGVHGFSYLPGNPPLTNAIYSTVSLTVLNWPLGLNAEIPWTLNVARFLAPALTGIAVIKTLLHLLAGFFEDMRRKRFYDHRIVCGLGQRGRFVALNQMDKNKKVVAIESNPTPEVVTFCENNKISLVKGNAANPEVLHKAGILKARDLFVFTGDDNLNLEIVHATLKKREEADLPTKADDLKCYLSVDDLIITELIPIHSNFKKDSDRTRVLPFNDHRNVARNLWDKMLKLKIGNNHCLPIEPSTKEHAHIVVAGFGDLSQAISLQIAYQAHFYNGNQTRLTLIDPSLHPSKINDQLAIFLERLSSVIDLRVHYTDPRNQTSREIIAAASNEEDSLSNVVICGESDSQNLRLAIHINQQLREAKQNQTPIFVRLKESTGLFDFLERETEENARLAKNKGSSDLINVHGFGLFGDTFSTKSILADDLEKMAWAIHRSFFQSAHVPSDNEARRAWRDLPEYSKESNRIPAEHLRLKCLSIGFNPDQGQAPTAAILEEHLEALAKMEHSRWMAEKLLTGWSPQESGKDTHSQSRKHKNLIPWEQLDEKEKQKDRNQVLAIPELLLAASEQSPEIDLYL